MIIKTVVPGALAAAFVALSLALRTQIDTSVWIALVVLSHAAVPFAAVFAGARPNSRILDIALAGITVTHIVIFSILPRGAFGSIGYLGIPVGFALYSFVAAISFAFLSRLRAGKEEPAAPAEELEVEERRAA
jgi:hypothetical protein